MIEFNNCTIRTGNFYAFKNLNLCVQAGKHYRISGANGSGKTLLAKTIAGKTDVQDGVLNIEGVNSIALKDLVSYVPARTFEMLFTASDNVFYQQRYYSVANQDVKTVKDFFGEDAILLQKWKTHPHLDISHLFDVKLTGLSNGQLRKLVLLKTLAKNPSVIVLDYPYEGLDHKSREELNELLEEIVAATGCSLIIVDNTNALPTLNFEIIRVDHFRISTTVQTSEPKTAKPLNWNTTPSKTESEVVIKCNNVGVSYGEKRVIDAFNWQVNKGERWLLSGENGSGKSTILSLLFADHPQAYKNEIYLWGKKRGTGETIWEIKNRISFLSAEMFTYASNSFKNNQKVEQFLLTHFQGPFELEHLDVRQLKKTADQMLAYFNLSHLKPVLFRNLSSGQKQLLLIIRTFLVKKSLILLDEPFQYLDYENKEKAKRFIHEQINTEDTLIVISHHKDSEFTGITHVKSM